ncbi:hypothetical protein AB0A73_20120 [Glycomyces sp. NPDC047369]
MFALTTAAASLRDGYERFHQLRDLVTDHLGLTFSVLDRDVEPSEEPEVNRPVLGFRQHLKKPNWIVEQLEQHVDRASCGLQPGAADPLQALGYPRELIPQFANLLVESSLRPVWITDQFQELILLPFEPSPLRTQLLSDFDIKPLPL